jgi:serine/threonine-protein phosphatase 2A regulatory subunit B
LRINIWNIEDSSTVYNLLDLKPNSLDELEEVVTKCEFHPTNPNMFLYTTSKGFLHLCDLRENSSFQNSSTMSIRVNPAKKKTLFSDLVNSLSEGKFMTTVDYGVVTRDYLGVKLWDLRSTSTQPEANYQVCDFVEKNLC